MISLEEVSTFSRHCRSVTSRVKDESAKEGKMHVKAGQSHEAMRETMSLQGDLIAYEINANRHFRRHLTTRVLGTVCDMVGPRDADLQISYGRKRKQGLGLTRFGKHFHVSVAPHNDDGPDCIH